MAPERTIQGQALRELVELPQVVGGLDEAEPAGRASSSSAAWPHSVVPVSNLETAELVKLSNNCHTDLIYSFGNEIALIAERHGLDPLEVIRAANLDYPRPDLAKPGYVGGGCLSKDPYIMIDSAGDREPFLVGRGPRAQRVPAGARRRDRRRADPRGPRRDPGRAAGRARLGLQGLAAHRRHARHPDRGDDAGLPEAGMTVLGHDPMVTDDVIRQYGGEPVSLDKAFSDADAVLVINDHPDYRALRRRPTMLGAQPASVIYDSWRILDEDAITGAPACATPASATSRRRLAQPAGCGVNALLLGGAGFIGAAPGPPAGRRRPRR